MYSHAHFYQTAVLVTWRVYLRKLKFWGGEAERVLPLEVMVL